ncbi:MAG TPA: plastocyanin/azurin family copper-binding protein [Leadbetterella sp.]|nr:plastocyanin/azurin family copper-binding protein [Leadbetterella sp.]
MKHIILTGISFLFLCQEMEAQQKPQTEDDFYKIITLPTPEGVEMEVGGLTVLNDGNIATSTRRGEIFLIKNPYMIDNTPPIYKRIAEGLHEVLGLNFIDNKFFATQRGEVTTLEDKNGDEIIDSYKTFYKWPLSGNYHQYSYGPILLPNKDMLFTLNLDWIGRGASLSKWRGWMLKISPDGKMTPWATGLRSPSGFNINKAGDIFYTENQGDWVGSGRVTHLEKGDFAGNAAGLIWSGEKDSPVKLTLKDIPDTGEPLYDVAKRVPGIKPPAVWFPHTLMGISTSDILELDSPKNFGPFEGQMFVGDQGHSKIMRMYLEKVNGVYQGACFPFREGFSSGILRMKWGLDGSMFVGMTSRGWASTGKEKFGLQRMVWTGATPFEMKTIKSMPDGFKIEFTQEVDKKTALDADNYSFSSFNYKYHHFYGSPVINNLKLKIKGIKLADDNMSVRIVLDTLRLGYIHEVKMEGILNSQNKPLLHNVGYYTLNQINSAETKIDLSVFGVKEKAMNHETHNMETMKVAPMPVSAKRISKMPESWNNTVDQTITIGTKPGLKFDISDIQVKPGSKIKLVFENNDDMLHNLLIVKPNTVDKVGKAALELGLEGAQQNYIPNLDEVIYHTGILEPESSETIYFIAPSKAGNYTFVCTFPGHYTLMQGTLRVK